MLFAPTVTTLGGTPWPLVSELQRTAQSAPFTVYVPLAAGQAGGAG